MKFSKDDEFGYTTTSLKELGSGLWVSVHLILKRFYDNFDQEKISNIESRLNVKIIKYDEKQGLFEVINFKWLGPSDI